MKLLRCGQAGREKPALLHADGSIRELSQPTADIGPEQLQDDRLQKLRAIDPVHFPIVEGTIRFGVPIAGVRKFKALGLNWHGT